MPDTIVKLDLHLDPDSTWALAQFLKRSRWEHFLACAVDEEEAHQIKFAVGRLEAALADKGYAPR
jgi:hypothetical protein